MTWQDKQCTPAEGSAAAVVDSIASADRADGSFGQEVKRVTISDGP